MFNRATKNLISTGMEIAENEDDFFPQLEVALDQPANTDEAQLCVDVALTQSEVIIVATMAGTPPDKLELHLHNDLLTIRGERFSPLPPDAEYFHQETYWGKFSRSIVLPVDVKHELSKAEYKNGVLSVHLPKIIADKSIPIVVIDE
ncbi:MAG: Hsp20/alpha crystallin family protein [bacterium]|nr:Hsp20/alpha crystallin family protein [Patescibacteria group bacterium]